MAAHSLANCIEAQTIHGAATKFYKRCYNDESLQLLLSEDTPPRLDRIARGFSIVVIDEAQDITPLLFGFTIKLLRDLAQQGHPPPQICVLGDPMQALYGFRGSDARYLTMADQLFPGPHEWVRLPLHQTFRLMESTAAFVNVFMLRRPLLVAMKPGGPPVQYVVGDPYSAGDYLALRLKDLIDKAGYSPGEIFVLATSLKGLENNKTPLAHFEHEVCVSRGRLLCALF